ncbi:MAG: ATP synthase F0 subunit B [Dissulfurispiraceae bacterium]
MRTQIHTIGHGAWKKIGCYFISCAMLSLTLIAAAFGAESGEQGGGSVMSWVWKIVNFGILVFLLVKFLGKPLTTFLRERKELIEKSIKESQEAKELAKKALSEVEERLKLKDKELEEIMAISKSSGDTERNRLIEEGERLKVAIVQQAKANIEHEVKTAKETIKAEAVEAAMQLAEEKIKARMTTGEQDRLLQESIKLLEGRN